MRKDNYIVRAWTADWEDQHYGMSTAVFKGTEQQCIEFCKKIFTEAATLLIPDGNEYELSLGFDLHCKLMRVVEITLYGREEYKELSYTRYYAIDYDWLDR